MEGVITDEVADVIEERAEVVGDFVRNLSQIKLGYTGLGIVIGGAIGAFAGFKVAYARANTKFDLIAQDEIAEMREHYQEKLRAVEAQSAKRPLEEIVREQGYSADDDTKPPMAIQPPEALVEEMEDAKEEPEIVRDESLEEHRARMLRRKRAMERDPQLRNVFEENPPPDDHWDYEAERARRTTRRPYVIHVDERSETDYPESTYTYYDVDNVLCNERDEVIAEGDERDELVGEANLNKFGHGSEDANIVYIRNDRLEMDIEICRSPNSYAEEVHGFDPPEPEIQHGDRHRGRPRFDDE
jgi:hypothetical protein